MDKRELDITAALACLELSESEVEELGAAVDQMLRYFESMSAVDVSGLAPTTHALVTRNRVREDRVEVYEERDGLLERAPELEDRYIVIPNVL